MGRLSRLTMFAFAAAGVLFLALALPSYEQLKSLFDLAAPDGDADRFTADLHGMLRIVVIVFAVLCALASLLVRRLHGRLTAVAITRPLRRWQGDAARFWVATPPSHRIAFLFIAIVGAVLRSLSIDLPMHSDESWTYLNYVSRNLLYIASQYQSPNNHVLHNLLASASITVLGDTPGALRLPSLLAGICTPLLAYWTFFRLGNRATALLAMTLGAVWPMLVDYAANARGYAMIVALTLALIVAADAIRARGHVAAFAMFAFVSGIGLYVIPSFVLSIFTAGAWLVLVHQFEGSALPAPRFYARLVVAGVTGVVFTLILYAPIIASNGVSALVANPVVTGAGVAVGSIQDRIFAIWTDWHQGVPLLLQLLLALGIVGACRGAPRLLGLWAALLTGAVLLSLAQGTVGPPRIWIFALPLLLGTAAHGLLAHWPQAWQAKALGALVLLVGTAMLVQYARDGDRSLYAEFGEYADAEAITAHLAEQLEADDGLATMFPANRTINYYARQRGIIQRVSQARTALRNGDASRTWVVALPGTQALDTLAWIDRLNGSSLATTPYEVMTEIAVGGSRLVLVAFE